VKGDVPQYRLAPREYGVALDAAMPVLNQSTEAEVLLCCNVPQLEAEARQRLAQVGWAHQERALWVEPLAGGWRLQLDAFARALPAGAPLVIVMSLPLARLLPERRGWQGRPVAMNPIEAWRFRHALSESGFVLQGAHGFHSMVATLLSLVSRGLARYERPDLADRWQFASRLAYRASGPLLPLSTVALLVCKRIRESKAR
jgi:hypothetical protein